MTPASALFTPSGVRLRKRTEKPGRWNWLLLPGGPGIGSDSLFELADSMNVPGTVWMVDLPGDGDNLCPHLSDPYQKWPDVLLEATKALPHCIYLGHSTGGMYLLNTPELESCVDGFVLVSSAPDARWMAHYKKTTEQQPLPGVDAAALVYAKEKTNPNLKEIAVASAEWNFTESGVEMGRGFLSRMPYNFEAVEWSDRYFDSTYVSKWWPKKLPVLILGGAEDRIVDQSLWLDPRFEGEHVLRKTISHAGHFPWLENPSEVSQAFKDFVSLFG